MEDIETFMWFNGYKLSKIPFGTHFYDFISYEDCIYTIVKDNVKEQNLTVVDIENRMFVTGFKTFKQAMDFVDCTGVYYELSGASLIFDKDSQFVEMRKRDVHFLTKTTTIIPLEYGMVNRLGFEILRTSY